MSPNLSASPRSNSPSSPNGRQIIYRWGDKLHVFPENPVKEERLPKKKEPYWTDYSSVERAKTPLIFKNVDSTGAELEIRRWKLYPDYHFAGGQDPRKLMGRNQVQDNLDKARSLSQR